MLQHRSRRGRTALSLVSAGAGAALLVGIVSGPAAAEGGDKEYIGGNPDCADLGYANEFKIDIDSPPAGTYADGDTGTESKGETEGFEVTISYSSDSPPVFDFESNTPVDAVLVKAGPGAYAYSYDPATTEGEGLKSKHGKDISHITFCWDGEVPPPPTTTVPVEPTTTVPVETPEDTTTTVPADDPAPTTTVPVELPGEPAEPAPPITGQPNFTG